MSLNRCIAAIRSSTNGLFRPQAHTRSLTTISPTDQAELYPHEPARWYKQSNRGLYGGQSIQFGNNVSDKNEIKTRRHWSPNIKRKNLFSKALGRNLQVRVSTRVMRTIDKVGGLDEYLLGSKSARIKELGVAGWQLRCQVMASKHMQAAYNKERSALGLPQLDRDAVIGGVYLQEGEDAAEAVESTVSKKRRIIRRR